jgi:ribose 1,5-bisphosphate isomerase
MLEGRVLAEAIAGQDIRVTLIADAAASIAMEQVDLVMVGADKITPVNLVNKIGTRMIALAARERGLPVYALCDTSKFIRDDCFGLGIRDLGGANELWPAAPRGVAVVNRCFEPTPLAFFTGIITEDGALSIEEVARRAEQAAIDKELVNAFGVLCDGIR